MRVDGVVTPKGRHVPFMTEPTRERPSFIELLRERGRQTALSSRTAASSPHVRAGSRQAAVDGRPDARIRPATRFTWPVRAPIRPSRATGNYAHVLEQRTRAVRTGGASAVGSVITDERTRAQSQPTA